MPQFHHHPDNLIFVRVEGKATYSDAPENFALDLGQPYSFAGKERLYEPGVRHFVDNESQNLSWPEGDSYIAAIDSLLAAQDARLNPPPTLEQAKGAGLATAQAWVAAQENEIDTLITGNPARAMLLNTELVDYFNAGQPADPSPARYELADVMARRRTNNGNPTTLKEMLDILLTRWRSLRSQIATLTADLDEATSAIEAATTVEEVQAALDALMN